MRYTGFSLIELLVALAILAIVSTIAVPLYTQYADRTYRSQAQSDLLNCAQSMERFASQAFSYENAADTNADGVGDADGPGPIANQICNPRSAAEGRYAITVLGTATSFTLTATPQGNLSEDGLMTYNSAGVRGWDHNDDGDTVDADEQSWEES